MLPRFHFFAGLIFSIILFLIFPSVTLLGAVIIFLSSFLIDFDHYVAYVFIKKDLSLKRAYKWFVKKRKKFLKLSRKERNQRKHIVCFLHGIEPLILVFFLGYFVHSLFYYVFIGFAFHILSDAFYDLQHWDRFHKLSIIYDFIKLKK